MYFMMLVPLGIGKTPTSEIFHSPLKDIEKEQHEQQLQGGNGDTTTGGQKTEKLRTLEQF